MMINGMTGIYILLMVAIQAALCTDCDIVLKIWKKMGKQTAIKGSSLKGCCQMSGVQCQGSLVISINWGNQGLNGKIPKEIGALWFLKRL